LRTRAWLRRGAVALLGGLLAGAVHAFGFPDVAAQAQKLAAQPYKAPPRVLPANLRELDYDAYRDIRFKPERALWRNEKLPFELMFFHLGRAVQEPVRINVVEPGGVRHVPFDPTAFDYGRNKVEINQVKGLDYAGFRIHAALNSPKYKDELLVFLGASYFRALGKGHAYGASARGLAVDTAAPSGEEFPRFTEFWIEKPTRRATSIVIHALLDSRRVAGAYRFVVTPGADTVMQVTGRLFLRAPVAKLGIAPLTSMYTFGENQPNREDFRPEVHDSDGLAVHTNPGEWMWRPLVNPRRLLVTSFESRDPQGFGLLQRDRSPINYEDPEALYERRPSLWVEPVGKWGQGRVELVQIPTPDETNDNIVAYWVGAENPPVGKPVDFAYNLHWFSPAQPAGGKAWVVQTRRGHAGFKLAPGEMHFVVDFDGAPLRTLRAGDKPEPAVIVDNNGELREKNLFKNPVSGLWRMTVRVFRRDAAKPLEMRAQLKSGETALSETWSYIVPPESERP
jgi:periplasmic glucans biosynthesis protein